VVNASDCGSDIRGFDSHQPPQFNIQISLLSNLLLCNLDAEKHLVVDDSSCYFLSEITQTIRIHVGYSRKPILEANSMGYSQAVRHRTLTATCVGSNPASPAIYFKAS
jgi:hypothetical protein